MHTQQYSPDNGRMAVLSYPHRPTGDNRWNRDLAIACETLRSLDHRQICQRCQDIIEAVNLRPRLDRVPFRVDTTLSNPACGLCNAIKCTEKRLNVQFSLYNLATGKIGHRCLTLQRDYQDTYHDDHMIVLYTHSLPLNRPWLDPWPRDPSRVDLHHLKRSLARCKSHHCKLSCEAPRIPVNGLRLLNCRNRVIEPATIDMEYVALSYVWGSAVSNSPSGSADQTTYDRTIEDAIIVALNFGYSYLWVDYLCIDQGGPHMESQLRQMDLIYQNADLTIFAAAGEDSSHGLPGVTTTSRSPRISFRSDDTLYYEIKRAAQRLIEDSKWDTRAWTFQEWIFSKRRLVFSETEAFFVCNTLVANEERGSECAPFSALLDQRLTAPHILAPSEWNTLPSGIITTNPWVTCSTIANYARRSLKYSSDALNAIEGVFRAFQRLESPTYNFWGIPILQFVSSRNGELHITDYTSFESFIVGLCWQEMQTEEMFARESMFPSWTWAGWNIIGPKPRHLDWSFSNYEHLLFYECTVTGIHVELSNGRMISWRDLAKLSFLQNAPQLRTPIISLESLTFEVSLLWLQSWKTPSVSTKVLKNYGKAEGLLTFDVARISICPEKHAYFPGMEEERLTGIILWDWGRSDALVHLRRIKYILLVKEKDEWAERVGHVEGLSKLTNDPQVLVRRRWLRLK